MMRRRRWRREEEGMGEGDEGRGMILGVERD